MRQVTRMILDCALLEHEGNPTRQGALEEAFAVVDSMFDRGSRVRQEALAEALVTADFPAYFAHTIYAKLMARYTYKTSGWKSFVYQDMVPTYQAVQRFRITELDANLDIRREKEEAYAEGMTIAGPITLAVVDFAKQVDFSKNILVNDDLGAFVQIPQMLGDSAARFEDQFVSALYDNALTQAALVALGAGYSGTGRLTTANLAIAYNAFVTRTDAMGHPLSIVPRYLVIPPILALTASQILLSRQVAELATNGINPFGPDGGGQFKLTVVEDPYIATAAPNIPWYLVADPSDVQTITLARLQGVSGPQLYIKAPDKIPFSTSGSMGSADWRRGSFATGDIELEVEDTIGTRTDALATLVGVTDANGIYYSSGTTP